MVVGAPLAGCRRAVQGASLGPTHLPCRAHQHAQASSKQASRCMTARLMGYCACWGWAVCVRAVVSLIHGLTWIDSHPGLERGGPLEVQTGAFEATICWCLLCKKMLLVRQPGRNHINSWNTVIPSCSCLSMFDVQLMFIIHTRVIPTMAYQDVYLDIFTDILPAIVSDIFSDIDSGILSALRTGILSNIFSGILAFFFLAFYWAYILKFFLPYFLTLYLNFVRAFYETYFLAFLYLL